MLAPATTVKLSAPSTTLSRELRLLLACVQTQVDDAVAGQLHNAAQPPLDWERVWTLGGHHGLLPLVYWRLVRTSATPPIPDPWRGRLEQAFYHNTARNLQLAAQLQLLLARLHAAGVPAIPLKGADLARRLYGNEALRQSGDLDVLVPAGRRATAEAEITALGYRTRRTPHGWVQQQNSRHDSFFRPEHGILLELHWNLTSAHQAVALDTAAIWARTQDDHFDGAPCRRLADADLALFLCLHGSKHHWSHLRWLADVALLTQQRTVDWEALLAQCAHTGCSRMLLLQTRLLATLCGLPAPPALDAAAAADRRLPGLVDRIVAYVEAPDRYLRANSLQLMALDASLRERPGDRLRALAASLTVTVGFHTAQLLSGARAPQRPAPGADPQDG